MPGLATLTWNDGDELLSSPAGSGTVYFQYAGGQRIRKFEQTTGAMTKERIYIGGWEVSRERSNGTVVSQEIETLHVHDDVERVLMVEEKTIGTGTGTYWRYQLSNHLGSASAELDNNGVVFSYEEYHPFGTSAYRAHDSSYAASPRRYRFTSMERDSETGLAYHGARYYAPWLGRWTASDPIGLGDGVNRFAYVSGNPVGFVDSTGTMMNPAAEAARWVARFAAADAAVIEATDVAAPAKALGYAAAIGTLALVAGAIELAKGPTFETAARDAWRRRGPVPFLPPRDVTTPIDFVPPTPGPIATPEAKPVPTPAPTPLPRAEPAPEAARPAQPAQQAQPKPVKPKPGPNPIDPPPPPPEEGDPPDDDEEEKKKSTFLFRGDDHYTGGDIGLPLGSEADVTTVKGHVSERKNKRGSIQTSIFTSFATERNAALKFAPKTGRVFKVRRDALDALEAAGEIRILTPEDAESRMRAEGVKEKKIRGVLRQMEQNKEVLIEGTIPGAIIQRAK